jgi:hypothetical protein
VALVIWYKEGKSTPIYSYDARDSKAADGGSHHGINLDGKFYFNTSSLNPATFFIANLTADDEGTYRCRGKETSGFKSIEVCRSSCAFSRLYSQPDEEHKSSAGRHRST